MGLNVVSLATGRRRESLLTTDLLSMEEQERSEPRFAGIVGQSAALPQVLKLVETVVTTDSTVLLVGETGTSDL